MDSENKFKIGDYAVVTQLKRKLKNYLADQGYDDFKLSSYTHGLIISLVMVLEEIVMDCLKNVTKDKTGLYTINNLVLRNMLIESDKYDFATKYMKKYNSAIRYHESVFFNIKKVMDDLETKHGSKLMIDPDSRNLISYILLNLQYDLTNLASKIIKFNNRKTLNISVMELVISYLLSIDLSSKIKLRLDSYNISDEKITDSDEAETETETETDTDANTDMNVNANADVDANANANANMNMNAKLKTKSQSNQVELFEQKKNEIELETEPIVQSDNKIEIEIEQNVKSKKTNKKNI